MLGHHLVMSVILFFTGQSHLKDVLWTSHSALNIKWESLVFKKNKLFFQKSKRENKGRDDWVKEPGFHFTFGAISFVGFQHHQTEATVSPLETLLTFGMEQFKICIIKIYRNFVNSTVVCSWQVSLFLQTLQKHILNGFILFYQVYKLSGIYSFHRCWAFWSFLNCLCGKRCGSSTFCCIFITEIFISLGRETATLWRLRAWMQEPDSPQYDPRLLT